MISVILPSYNSEKFIIYAIDSVLNQSFKEFELIIIDDCSSDSTVELIRNHALHDARVSLYVLSQNSGAGVARNFGLSKAKYSVIAFLDSDDLWTKEKLEIQYEFMKSRNAGICHTSYSFIGENGNRTQGYVKASDLVSLENYMSNTEIGLSTSMLDLSVVGKIEFQSVRTRQDTLLWISLLSKGYYSCGLDLDLCRYRVSYNQISKNKFKMLYRTFSVYMSVKNLPLWKRFFLFTRYAVNGILKRI